MLEGRYDNDSRRYATLPILIILGAIVAIGAFAWARFDRDPGGPASDLPLRAVTPRGDLADIEKTNIAIFRRSLPSVASVTTKEVRRRFGGGRVETERGSGSGIVWDRKGHIVTNFHVIEADDRGSRQAAQRVVVQLATMADPVDAQVVGSAPEFDLAVLKVDVDPSLLAPIAIGESGNLQVGQSVIAIGNPFGLSQTMTTGIVSQLNRRLEASAGRVIEDVIQTDAAINPGNSGGPLIDSAGRLIGVNSAIYSGQGEEGNRKGNIGIGFAIPIDSVNWVVAMLIRYRKIIRPKIGARLRPTSTLNFWRGVEGLYVVEAVKDGPAVRAGIRDLILDDRGMKIVRHGDVITHVEGRRVKTTGEFQAVLEETRERSSVEVRYEREGRSAVTRVDLVAHDYFDEK